MIDKINRISKKKTSKSYRIMEFLWSHYQEKDKPRIFYITFFKIECRQKPFIFLNYSLNHIITKNRKANKQQIVEL